MSEKPEVDSGEMAYESNLKNVPDFSQQKNKPHLSVWIDDMNKSTKVSNLDIY